MNYSCRACNRTDLKKEDLRKDAAVYKGICKPCWSKEQACTALLKRVEANPHRYNNCTYCDRFFSKVRHSCPSCKGVNFVSVKGMK